jgi:ribosome modulation factor
MSTVELARAQQRALRLYPRSKGFRSAYLAGARAALAGRPVDACPYRRDPGKTWRQAYRLAWMRGYESISPLPIEEVV